MLVFILSGCSYNESEYFGEYSGSDSLREPQQSDIDYLLTDFNAKDVTSRNVTELSNYDFIETHLLIKESSNERVSDLILDNDENNSNSSNGSDKNYHWSGSKLTKSGGVNNGPSGKETYYNLNMSGCIRIMKDLGYNYRYWVRSDGVKMYGDYVMIAADLSIRPKGTHVPTSLGMGIVVDTGSFVKQNKTQIDIAVSW